MAPTLSAAKIGRKAAMRSSFAAAHRLREYEGNCEQLHGHNWRVEATVESSLLDDRGMAMDFRSIKDALHDILSGMDHKYLNEIPPFDELDERSRHWLEIEL